MNNQIRKQNLAFAVSLRLRISNFVSCKDKSLQLPVKHSMSKKLVAFNQLRTSGGQLLIAQSTTFT
jgi:hypothetical protein